MLKVELTKKQKARFNVMVASFHPKIPKKIEAEIIKWHDGVYSIHATIRTGSLETGNHNSPSNAKRSFIAMCSRLGINKEIFEFRNE